MKKFMLSIPTPCHEDWDKMTSQEKGKFCSACQKTVFDFTAMSDGQIAEFFSKNKGVCGRFNSTQLQREIMVPPKPIPWAHNFFRLALPAFLLSMKTSAQGEVKVKPIACAAPVKGKIKALPAADSTGVFSIKGKVVDSDERPIAGATVTLQGTNSSTLTDDEGFFHFGHVKTEKATVTISAVGYESKSLVLAANDTAVIPVATLVPQLAGEVVVVTAGFVNVKRKDVPVPSIPKITKPEAAFSVFPNPANPRSAITVETTKIKKGRYQLAILNGLGVAVQANEVVFDKSIKRVMIELKDLAAGQYYVQLLNRDTGKVYAEAIVVQ